MFDIASARAFKKAQLRWFAEIYGAFSMFLESPKCRVFQKYRDNCEDDGARSGNINACQHVSTHNKCIPPASMYSIFLPECAAL